jgi:hypothetical protein
VDYATTWVELRAMWGRGQAGTLAALRDVEASLPFELLGLDSDNGGEFLNYHVLSWLQKRSRPVFMTRSRPYKKDDNAHVEQKNWTHIRQCFGYERHDNPEVVELINALVKGAYGQLLNYFHASLKLEAQGAHPRAAAASLRRAPNAPGAGIGQRPGEAADQAPIGTGEGTLESLCAQALGCPKLEGYRFAAPGALLTK